MTPSYVSTPDSASTDRPNGSPRSVRIASGLSSCMTVLVLPLPSRPWSINIGALLGPTRSIFMFALLANTILLQLQRPLFFLVVGNIEGWRHHDVSTMEIAQDQGLLGDIGEVSNEFQQRVRSFIAKPRHRAVASQAPQNHAPLWSWPDPHDVGVAPTRPMAVALDLKAQPVNGRVIHRVVNARACGHAAPP